MAWVIRSKQNKEYFLHSFAQVDIWKKLEDAQYFNEKDAREIVATRRWAKGADVVCVPDKQYVITRISDGVLGRKQWYLKSFRLGPTWTNLLENAPRFTLGAARELVRGGSCGPNAEVTELHEYTCTKCGETTIQVERLDDCPTCGNCFTLQ